MGYPLRIAGQKQTRRRLAKTPMCKIVRTVHSTAFMRSTARFMEQVAPEF